MSPDSQLSPFTLLLILSAVVLLGFGQILFKLAAATIQFGNVRTLFSLPLLSALAVYGVATLVWIGALARVPLSVAFPFYGLGFIFVPMLSVLILREPFRWSTVVGGVVIMLGIVISSRDW